MLKCVKTHESRLPAQRRKKFWKVQKLSRMSASIREQVLLQSYVYLSIMQVISGNKQLGSGYESSRTRVRSQEPNAKKFAQVRAETEVTLITQTTPKRSSESSKQCTYHCFPPEVGWGIPWGIRYPNHTLPLGIGHKILTHGWGIRHLKWKFKKNCAVLMPNWGIFDTILWLMGD